MLKIADKGELVLEPMRKAGKPMKSGEVVEVAGMDAKEVSRLITSLKEEGDVTSPERCCYAPTKYP